MSSLTHSQDIVDDFEGCDEFSEQIRIIEAAEADIKAVLERQNVSRASSVKTEHLTKGAFGRESTLGLNSSSTSLNSRAVSRESSFGRASSSVALYTLAESEMHPLKVDPQGLNRFPFLKDDSPRPIQPTHLRAVNGSLRTSSKSHGVKDQPMGTTQPTYRKTVDGSLLSGPNPHSTKVPRAPTNFHGPEEVLRHKSGHSALYHPGFVNPNFAIGQPHFGNHGFAHPEMSRYTPAQAASNTHGKPDINRKYQGPKDRKNLGHFRFHGQIPQGFDSPGFLPIGSGLPSHNPPFLIDWEPDWLSPPSPMEYPPGTTEEQKEFQERKRWERIQNELIVTPKEKFHSPGGGEQRYFVIDSEPTGHREITELKGPPDLWTWLLALNMNRKFQALNPTYPFGLIHLARGGYHPSVGNMKLPPVAMPSASYHVQSLLKRGIRTLSDETFGYFDREAKIQGDQDSDAEYVSYIEDDVEYVGYSLLGRNGERKESMRTPSPEPANPFEPINRHRFVAALRSAKSFNSTPCSVRAGAPPMLFGPGSITSLNDILPPIRPSSAGCRFYMD